MSATCFACRHAANFSRHDAETAGLRAGIADPLVSLLRLRPETTAAGRDRKPRAAASAWLIRW